MILGYTLGCWDALWDGATMKNFLDNFFINLLSATLLPAVCTRLDQNWALQIFGNTGKRILLASAEFILFCSSAIVQFFLAHPCFIGGLESINDRS